MAEWSKSNDTKPCRAALSVSVALPRAHRAKGPSPVQLSLAELSAESASTTLYCGSSSARPDCCITLKASVGWTLLALGWKGLNATEVSPAAGSSTPAQPPQRQHCLGMHGLVDTSAGASLLTEWATPAAVRCVCCAPQHWPCNWRAQAAGTAEHTTHWQE